MKALRKIAVIIVVLFLAFGPLLAVIPAFGQVTDPKPVYQYTYIYTEGISMQVDAPEGYVFTNVVWADFGAPYYDEALGEYVSDPNCTTAVSTMEKLFKAVYGKSSVLIPAYGAIYGNPCPGQIQSLGFTIEARPLKSLEPSQTPTPTTPKPTVTPTVPVSPPTPTSEPSTPTATPSITATPTPTPQPQKSPQTNGTAWVGLSPEARAKAKKVVVATVIVSQIATTASMIRKRK